MQAKINQTKRLKCIYVIIKLHDDDCLERHMIKKPQLRGFLNL